MPLRPVSPDTGGAMPDKQVYGRTRSGAPFTDDLIDELADEAERRYDALTR